MALHETDYLLLGSLDLNCKDLFTFSSVKSKDTMARNLFNGFLIIIIVVIYSFLFSLSLGLCGRHYETFGIGLFTYPLSETCTVCQCLRDDIFCTCNGRLNIRNFLFFIYILKSFLCNRNRGFSRENEYSQGFETSFLSDHGSGAALRFIRTIDILKFYRGLSFVDLLSEFVSKFTLLFYGSKDSVLSVLQVTEIF